MELFQVVQMEKQKRQLHIKDHPHGPIYHGDLQWTTSKQRFGNDAYVGVVIAYILWERMEDFKNGQAMEGGQVVECGVVY